MEFENEAISNASQNATTKERSHDIHSYLISKLYGIKMADIVVALVLSRSLSLSLGQRTFRPD